MVDKSKLKAKRKHLLNIKSSKVCTQVTHSFHAKKFIKRLNFRSFNKDDRNSDKKRPLKNI